MHAKSVKILAIGGSNTRKVAGYMASVRGSLEAKGVEIERVWNLALGANTCVMGLLTLATAPDIKAPDVVIIEYAVNDYAMISAGQNDLWYAAYEGLVRQVTRRFPAALVCCVILGRADSHPDRWKVITDGVSRIAANYINSIVINCPLELHAGSAGDELTQLFDDPLHYSQEMQNSAGQLIGDRIFTAPPISVIPLPAPTRSSVLDPATVIDFASLASKDKVEFKNSAVQVEAVPLRAGASISVDLPGRLVAISFVSRVDSGSFEMSWNGRTALVHTLHRDVGSGKFPFLPLSAFGDWWEGENESGTLTIRPVSGRDEPADWPVFHVGPSPEGSASVYLHQALVRTD